jgi:RNA polymerase sigma-70 factor (ECF subfamily)
VDRSEQRAVVERFMVALRTGQLQELMELMAPDVVLIADGGGIAAAVRAPIHGVDRVAKLLARANAVAPGFETATVWLNGALAGRFEIDGEPTAMSLSMENGRVTRIYVMRNPRKLTRLDVPTAMAR